MQGKSSLVLSYDLEAVFLSLPPMEAGLLIRAIYAYEIRKEEPQFEAFPILNFTWKTNVKLRLDKMAENYQAVCDARKAAGSKGGRPKTDETQKAKKPNGFSEKQKNQMVFGETKGNQTKAKKPIAKEYEYECDSDSECDSEGDGDNNTVTPGSDSPAKPGRYKKFMDAWNTLPINHIVSLRGERLKLLQARLREFSEEDILKAIDIIGRCPFLLGHNKKGWTIDFDWFVRPNNFPKVLEGRYLDSDGGTGNGNATGQGFPPGMDDPTMRRLWEEEQRTAL